MTSTKAEYERLEEELETLNERLDSLKEEQQQNALGKQQFEGQMQVLEEQILAGRQSSEHFKSRLATLKRRTCTSPGRTGKLKRRETDDFTKS